MIATTNEGKSEPHSYLHTPIYEVIATAVRDNPDIDVGTKNWLAVAEKIDSGHPTSLVRNYIEDEPQSALAKKWLRAPEMKPLLKTHLS